MKIIIYCQHVLGVGHFFRTLEIARAMEKHDVILVTGGGQLEVTLPKHVQQFSLPGLMMDSEFTGLYPANSNSSIDEIKNQRKTLLKELVENETPDLFLIELYPFGRKAFRFELEPILEYVKNQTRFPCKVVCSLRDILVEKQDKHLHEKRVVKSLNTWFDAVLVHSDPELIKLDATFERMDQIKIPIQYTGFVTPMPNQKKTDEFILQKQRSSCEKMVVASAGGGNVGAKLLRSVVKAYTMLLSKKTIQIKVFTGPYMDEDDKKWLYSFRAPGLEIEEFSSDFVSLLKAADLSISMAGYNTCMNITAAGVPALVWPFDQNNEQRDRVEKLFKFAPLTLLEDSDLDPNVLAEHIEKQLKQDRQETKMSLNIDGAATTVKIIERLV